LVAKDGREPDLDLSQLLPSEPLLVKAGDKTYELNRDVPYWLYRRCLIWQANAPDEDDGGEHEKEAIFLVSKLLNVNEKVAEEIGGMARARLITFLVQGRFPAPTPTTSS
jgi:hypothetical protein